MDQSSWDSAIRILPKGSYPALLRELERLPPQMDIIGQMPPESYRYLCIVGSRKHDQYGRESCEYLIKGLRGYPIVIVSGLAPGIDSIAHESALEAGLKTIAFPGSGLYRRSISPQSNLPLADRIIASGGALISPFKRFQRGDSWTYPVRNALMAGISHATLIVQGAKDSGTSITADDAGEFNRLTLAIPGSIFSTLSCIPHDRLREGATAVTCPEDILEALGFGQSHSLKEERSASLFDPLLSDEEKNMLETIGGSINKDELIYKLKMPVGYINSVLSELELKGIVREDDGTIVRKKI